MRYHPRADRAKMFAPFDVLVEFREALAKKERIIVPKVELSEDMKEEPLPRPVPCSEPLVRF